MRDEALPEGDYRFREDTYPLSELAMSEAPPELANLLIDQAREQGVELIRDQVVELICQGPGISELGFTIFWPKGDKLHILVPRQFVKGRG